MFSFFSPARSPEHPWGGSDLVAAPARPSALLPLIREDRILPLSTWVDVIITGSASAPRDNSAPKQHKSDHPPPPRRLPIEALQKRAHNEFGFQSLKLTFTRAHLHSNSSHTTSQDTAICCHNTVVKRDANNKFHSIKIRLLEGERLHKFENTSISPPRRVLIFEQNYSFLHGVQFDVFVRVLCVFYVKVGCMKTQGIWFWDC